MKLLVGDDVGQIKLIKTRTGINTSLQTSARPQITSYLSPNHALEIQGICILPSFRSRKNLVAIASCGGLVRVLDPSVPATAPEAEQIVFRFQIPDVPPEERVVAFGFERGVLYVCTESGFAEFWEFGEGEDKRRCGARFGERVGAMRIWFNDDDDGSDAGVGCVPKAVAVGGKERDLEIYESSIGDGEETISWKSVWKAKNVKPDIIGLEVPVWITCILFLPSPPPSSTSNSEDKTNTARNWRRNPTVSYRLATATHHSHLRLYDTTVSRRPAFTTALNPSSSPPSILQLQLHPSFPPPKTLTPSGLPPSQTKTTDDTVLIYTDSVGYFGVYSTAQRREAGIYSKDSNGAVLGVTTAKGNGGLVAGVGFDRYLRIYKAKSRELLSKVYVKTKGTSVAILDCTDDDEVSVEEAAKKSDTEEQERGEYLWEGMDEVVGEAVDEEDMTAKFVGGKRSKEGYVAGAGGGRDRRKKRRV